MKVCSCASMFKFSYRPSEFFPRGQFLLKITTFNDFWGRMATFLKLQLSHFAWGCGPGASSPGNFFKYRLKIYHFGANLYQKLAVSADFWAVSPHIRSQNGKIWREVAYLGDPPQAKFSKNQLRGYIPLGQIFTKNNYGNFENNFGDFGGCKPTLLKPKGLNLALGCGPVIPLTRAKFCKNRVRGVSP